MILPHYGYWGDSEILRDGSVVEFVFCLTNPSNMDGLTDKCNISAINTFTLTLTSPAEQIVIKYNLWYVTAKSH